MSSTDRDIEHNPTVRDFVTTLAVMLSRCTCPELGVLLYTDGHGSIVESEWGHLPTCPWITDPRGEALQGQG